MTNTNSSNPFEIINKEDVPNYHFVSYEVLENETEKRQRNFDLEKAMILGNADHVKIKIFFMTEEGLKEVETTVWAATDESIMLKGGIPIPIHCISRIEFI